MTTLAEHNSAEFVAGLRAGDPGRTARNPYVPGTVEADRWYAGRLAAMDASPVSYVLVREDDGGHSIASIDPPCGKYRTCRTTEAAAVADDESASSNLRAACREYLASWHR